MFECMEISEYIYKGVLEPSYKTPTQAESNRAGNSRQKRGEAASQWNRPEKGDRAGKRRKRYIYDPIGKSKTCLIHGPEILQKNVRSWDTSELSTLLVGLLRTTGAALLPGKINSHEENNVIVNNSVYAILLAQKVSSTDHESP